MKLFGFPMAYVVIAVGVLGFVVLASVQRPAPFDDGTAKCVRNLDFSHVEFSPEAKADWEKCYMPGPLWENSSITGKIECLNYPEESCRRCSAALVLKYNDSKYCELFRPCKIPENVEEDIEEKIELCKKFIIGKKFKSCNVTLNRANVNHSFLDERIEKLFPGYREDSDKRHAALVDFC